MIEANTDVTQENFEDIVERHQCLYCDEDSLTRRELVTHGNSEHPDEVTGNIFFFKAYESSYNAPLYMMVCDSGKSFLYYEQNGKLEEATEWSKFFHDWEQVVFEETPFTDYRNLIED